MTPVFVDADRFVVLEHVAGMNIVRRGRRWCVDCTTVFGVSFQVAEFGTEEQARGLLHKMTISMEPEAA